MVCVLCEVRTEVLYVIQTNFVLQSFINYVCNGIIFALWLLSTSQNTFKDMKCTISLLSVAQAFPSQIHSSSLQILPEVIEVNSCRWLSKCLVTNFTLDGTVVGGGKQFQSYEQELKLGKHYNLIPKRSYTKIHACFENLRFWIVSATWESRCRYPSPSCSHSKWPWQAVAITIPCSLTHACAQQIGYETRRRVPLLNFRLLFCGIYTR